MSDHKARLAERQAQADNVTTREDLVERMRRGDITEGQLVLAAYCGDRASRELKEWPRDDGFSHGPGYISTNDPCSVGYFDSSGDMVTCCYCAELPAWATGLISQATACAPAVLSVPCSLCGPLAPGKLAERNDWGDWEYSKCFECTGTGRTTVEIPAEQHVAVLVGVKVARACLPPQDDTRPWGPRLATRDAVISAEAWLLEPSEANRDACNECAQSDWAGSRPRDGAQEMEWAWGAAGIASRDPRSHSVAERLQFLLTSAATLLDEKTVRTIASKAVREWALMEALA